MTTIHETEVLAQAAKLLADDAGREETAYTLALGAYRWGLPLYFYGIASPQSVKIAAVAISSRLQVTHTAKDQFSFAANTVTFDTYSAFDVSQEPVVLTLPPAIEALSHDVQIYDRFDDTLAHGLHAAEANAYAITGSNFWGTVPSGLKRVVSQSGQAVALVRMFVRDQADIAKALQLQRAIAGTSFSTYLRNGTPPAHRSMLGTEIQSGAPADVQYLEEGHSIIEACLRNCLDINITVAEALREIGVNVLRGFEWKSLDDASKRGLNRAIKAAEHSISQRWQRFGEANGWRISVPRSTREVIRSARLFRPKPVSALAWVAERTGFASSGDQPDRSTFD
jgi:hypothetical protein